MAGDRGWSPETEAAFLEALKARGTVKGACAAIGKWPNNAYHYRKTAPGFAARWDAVAEAIRLEKLRAVLGEGRDGAGMIPRYRVRHDGWTEKRQKAFLRALAETGCVTDACKRVRISSVSAYRIRRRAPEFARAWERALAKAAPTIEQAAFTRAVEGWDEPIVHGGRVVATKRRYSDSLLRLLLTRGGQGGVGGSAKVGDAAGAEAAPREGVTLPALKHDSWGRLHMPDGTPVDNGSPVGQAWLAALAMRQGVQHQCDGSGAWTCDPAGRVRYQSGIEAKAEVARRLEQLAPDPGEDGAEDAAGRGRVDRDGADRA